ncbi:hypothetical protein B0H10DRAFT_1942556 [Mycena sp. CBHHK59/15]|nr:hypothetical protein B0H10DRAFT_1942556 [Mycena sp. CBHHK59/15]
MDPTTFGVLAGAFNIASLGLGSGPDAISRLNKMELLATENADFVMRILESYGHYLTKHEHRMLNTGYHALLKSISDAQKERSKNRTTLQKLVGFGKAHKATQKVLEKSQATKGMAKAFSDKARLRNQYYLSEEKETVATAHPDAGAHITYPAVKRDESDEIALTRFQTMDTTNSMSAVPLVAD